jgi:hypothetical protein
VKAINPIKFVIQLTYDIVNEYYSELSVRPPSEKLETKESEGTEFVIQIPNN